jgi:hypothetical protein
MPKSTSNLENSLELPCNLAFRVWNFGLPQFDGIPLRVMQAGEPAVGIRLRVNLDLDSRGLKLGRHFVEIPDSKVQHPDLGGIPEVAARLLEWTESGGPGLLLPPVVLRGRWYRQNPQVLLIPKPQRFRIFGSKEESSDSGDFFRFRSCCDPITNSGPRRGRGDLWRCGCPPSDAEFVPIPDEARPESK